MMSYTNSISILYTYLLSSKFHVEKKSSNTKDPLNCIYNNAIYAMNFKEIFNLVYWNDEKNQCPLHSVSLNAHSGRETFIMVLYDDSYMMIYKTYKDLE